MIHKHTLVLLSICVGLNAFLIDYTFDQIWMGLGAKFKSKCESLGGPLAFTELQIATLDLNACAPIKFNEPDTICTDQRKNSYDCYEEFFGKLEKCLYPQEMYMKDLILYAHNTTFDVNCKDEGNDLLVKRSAFEKSTCLKRGEEIYLAFVKTCAPNLSIVRNLYKRDDVITEEDLCNDLELLTECKIGIENICEDYQDFQNFFGVVFGSYRKACEHELAKKKAVSELQTE